MAETGTLATDTKAPGAAVPRSAKPRRGKASEILLSGLGRDNPVFAQILGICSTLAVTNSVRNTIVMCLGLVWASSMSNISVSILRRKIPSRVRMIIETLIIAVWVIIVDIAFKAFVPDISRQLGPYVGLIITNCIVMGRTEAFALSNPPHFAFLDGVSSALGYSYVLLIIASVREIMGFGTWLGFPLLGSWWTKWSIMTMAPSAFFLLAVLIWVVRGSILKEGGK